MRVEFHILASPVPEVFRAMTYGLHGKVLEQNEPAPGFLPIGVVSEGKALGFGLARAGAEGGEVLSLFVAPELWGNGVGTRLLEELERGLRRWGCSSVKIGYSTQSPSVPRLEKILAKGGWTAPVTRMLLAQMGPPGPSPPVWMAQTRVPADYEVFAWSELSAEDRVGLERVRNEVPPALWPFTTNEPDSREEEPLEPVCSVGVRRGEEIVGWMVCHRVAPELIRFSYLYVREAWRTRRLTLSLLAEALRRKEAVYGDAVVTTLAVRIENQAMLRLTERKFRPYARSWHEMRVAEKPLPPF